ncbi:MAG TPA: hypothetical protein VKB87_02610 [Myxococcaceae bacterium]|nr:hypothetical protein [Myxococcaceae bacterium]
MAHTKELWLNSPRALPSLCHRVSSIAQTCLAAVLCAGCCAIHYAYVPPPPPPPPPLYLPPDGQAPPPFGQAPTPPPPMQSQCGPSIRGLDELAHPGGMILLADVPGSEQIPDFISDAACRQAESGMGVFIGLEIPEEEQSRIDEFLHSAGTDGDRARLLESEFWQRPEQDGRSSRAVLQLIDDVRQMIHSGYRVALFAYDASPDQGTDRNAAMAENIEAAREHAPPDALFLVLAGTARLYTPAGEMREPLDAHLRRKERWLTSLTAAFEDGSAWTCEGPTSSEIQCGTHAVRGRRGGPSWASSGGGANHRFVARWPRPSPDGVQGSYYLGALTASPPALDVQVQEPAADATKGNGRI